MSLLNKASLIQIPSGYKDGTLYSAKPTNGDGDFTFSRGSNLAATRVNSDGLIEKGRENLLTYSNDLSNAAWTKTRGSVSGNKWIPDTTNNYHNLGRTATIQNGSVYAYSIEVKADGYDFVLLNIPSGMGTNSGPIIDLTDGTLAGTYNGYDHNAIIESVEDGYYRVKMWFVSTTTSLQLDINPLPTSSVATYSGDNTKGILVRRIQLEQGLVATDYIETGATTAQAGILEDMPRLDYSGGATCGHLLLEPQRSNLFTQSENFTSYWVSNGGTRTPNQSTSPDGGLNATEFLFNSYASGVYTPSFAAGTYTMSIFIKPVSGNGLIRMGLGLDNSKLNTSTLEITNQGTGNGSLIDYGNGWYRFITTITTSSSTSANIYNLNSNNVTAYIYGAMLEAGSYPTSYIPTYGGSSVTRGQDAMYKTGVSDLINSSLGTIFIETEFNSGSTTYTERIIKIDDGSSSNQIGFSRYSTNNLNFYLVSGGVSQSDIVISGAAGSYTNMKLAVSYQENRIKVFRNGQEIGSDLTATMAVGLSRILFANDTSGNLLSDQEIKQLLIFPTALTDAECIQLTTL